MKMVFTSGRKYKKLHSGVLGYADFKKIGNHVIGPRVPTQNWGLKLGYAVFFKLNYICNNILTFADLGVFLTKLFYISFLKQKKEK